MACCGSHAQLTLSLSQAHTHSIAPFHSHAQSLTLFSPTTHARNTGHSESLLHYATHTHSGHSKTAAYFYGSRIFQQGAFLRTSDNRIPSYRARSTNSYLNNSVSKSVGGLLVDSRVKQSCNATLCADVRELVCV